jgi:hypothetical protein
MNPTKFWNSIAEIKNANKARGHFWFSDDTMRFFRSKIHGEVIGGKYFVHSIQYGDDHPRQYKFSWVNQDASIGTDQRTWPSVREVKYYLNDVVAAKEPVAREGNQ